MKPNQFSGGALSNINKCYQIFQKIKPNKFSGGAFSNIIKYVKTIKNQINAQVAHYQTRQQ